MLSSSLFVNLSSIIWFDVVCIIATSFGCPLVLAFRPPDSSLQLGRSFWRTTDEIGDKRMSSAYWSTLIPEAAPADDELQSLWDMEEDDDDDDGEEQDIMMDPPGTNVKDNQQQCSSSGEMDELDLLWASDEDESDENDDDKYALEEEEQEELGSVVSSAPLSSVDLVNDDDREVEVSQESRSSELSTENRNSKTKDEHELMARPNKPHRQRDETFPSPTRGNKSKTTSTTNKKAKAKSIRSQSFSREEMMTRKTIERLQRKKDELYEKSREAAESSLLRLNNNATTTSSLLNQQEDDHIFDREQRQKAVGLYLRLFMELERMEEESKERAKQLIFDQEAEAAALFVSGGSHGDPGVNDDDDDDYASNLLERITQYRQEEVRRRDRLRELALWRVDAGYPKKLLDALSLLEKERLLLIRGNVPMSHLPVETEEAMNRLLQESFGKEPF